MTWDDVNEWLWHLFNDPIRENWWAFGLVTGLIALSIIGLLTFLVGVSQGRRRAVWRRNRRDQLVSEPTEQTGQTEGNGPGSYSYIETPQQQRERRDRTAHRRPTMSDGPASPDPIQYVPAVVSAIDFGQDDGPTAGRPEMLADLPPTDLRSGETDDRQRLFYPTEVPGPADSGVHAIPSVRAERQPCPECKGTGYMPSQNDLLRESIALVGDGGDVIVREFYTRLLHAAPDLASLFPADLLQSDETHHQRDRLLKALVALSQSYDRTDPDGMNRLDVTLGFYGRNHAAFQRPDGTVSGATLEEYAAVKGVLFATLIEAAGPAWKPEYTAAWSDAYDYAAGVMMAEQRRTEMTVPRMPRA